MQIRTPYGPLELDVDAYALPPTFPIVLPICRELRMAEIVDACCPMKWWSHVTHGQVVEFVVLHLLQSPHRQPLYKLEQWSAEHHLHRLYDCPAEAFNDDRVGRALDEMASHIAEIETRVVTEALMRYRVNARQIHWDLKHVTFSGAHEGSAMICKGYGAGAIHAKQLQVSLHVTGEGGLPVRHQTLAGDAHQAPLAADRLKDLQPRLPCSDLIVVSDRAGISYENILAYRRAKARFVAPLALQAPQQAALAAVPPEAFVPLEYRSHGAPHEQYSYYQTTLELNPQGRHEPLQVPALFVHNTGKQRRDAERRQKKIDQAWARLQKINDLLNQRRYAKADYAREQLAKAVPPAVREIVRYELTGEDRELCLRFGIDQTALAAAAATDGRYVLVYELPAASPEEIFLTHKRQSAIEARFRNLNSDLSVHPLWLQHDPRIQALLLIFVLALIVYTLLELCAERAGLEGPHYPKMTAREML
ncbi:MAG: IS1634 family transposase, partial [Chloroflexi bacterium]|nr:IS1634 family transposase [Chloroflexota bacterium]